MKTIHRLYISVQFKESYLLGLRFKAFNSIDGRTTKTSFNIQLVEVGYANKHYWKSSKENNEFLDYLMLTYGITFDRLQRIFDGLHSGKKFYAYNYVRDLDSISKCRAYKHLNV